jgi:hypothetical protein
MVAAVPLGAVGNGRDAAIFRPRWSVADFRSSPRGYDRRQGARCEALPAMYARDVASAMGKTVEKGDGRVVPLDVIRAHEATVPRVLTPPPAPVQERKW